MRDCGFLQAIHCKFVIIVLSLTIGRNLLSNVSDAQINRGGFGAKFGDEVVDQCKLNFNAF